jgi:hypothetical protein
MSKLWIIGDSFSGSGDGVNFLSWTQILCKKFKGKKYYVSSKGSRDFQTIFDIFLRNLKNISPEDFVILVIPTLKRTRLPLKTPVKDIEESNDNLFHMDYFIGSHGYDLDNPDKELEEPFTGLPHDFFQQKQIGLTDNLQTIINASKANVSNTLEILDSIKSYVPFEIFLWSWTDELVSPIVKNKSKIEEEIGYWHTLWDDWNESNGLIGKNGDSHFSSKMHKAFADYLIVKFPQFFNL